jgi:hypothetical protein
MDAALDAPDEWTKESVLKWGHAHYGKNAWSRQAWSAWADEQLAVHHEEQRDGQGLPAVHDPGEGALPPRVRPPSPRRRPLRAMSRVRRSHGACALWQKIHTEPRMADLCAALSATGILDLYAGALDDTTTLPDEERVVRAHAALVRMRTTPLAQVAKRLDDVIAMLAPRAS